MAEITQHFMGLDGFVWFTGVVEDRNDPDKLGRVRVRCLGHHTEDLNDIPTKDLPWAHVMHPVTDPSMGGLGNTPSFLVEGSWVVGFFLDVKEKQQPLIIGSLPGKPIKRPDYKKGFNDPRSKYSEQIEYAGTPTYGPYPLFHKLNEPDTNRLARGEVGETLIALRRRRKNRETEIPTATQPYLSTVSDEAIKEDRGKFEEPHPRGIDYNLEDPLAEEVEYRSGQYPYNHVFESESGHITEVDDTPGGERTFRSHRSGTYEEIVADGTKTTKVIGDNYEIILGGSNVHIGGAVNLTITGDVRQLIEGNYHLEVVGNYTQKIHKNMRTKIGAGDIGGNLEEEINGSHAKNITGATKIRHAEDVDTVVGGSETRQVNGTYDLSVRSNILAASTNGTVYISAHENLIGLSSGIVSVSAGSTLNMKSAEDMTIKSETNIDMDATTLIDITAPTVDINGSTAINLN